LTLGGIGELPVVLPPLEEQLRLVALQRRLEELRAELDAAHRDLWRSREGARSAARTLDRFPSNDDLEIWLPRLPYPLASILWTYRAVLDPRRRVEILFAFFEATAEFLAVILLSGLRSNNAIFERLKEDELRELTTTGWRSASIGFWATAGAHLAKTVRRMLSSEDRTLCLDLYRCSGRWLDAVASKELFGVLGRVVELRNAWKGHGGVESETETLQRLDRLQSELTALFTPLTVAFEELSLVRPKTFEYDGEVYTVVVDDLAGSLVPFRETTLRVLSPMKTGALYLLENDGSEGLEILPFLRMQPGPPAATACYFYSRVGAQGARFVSYHQAQESEIIDPDPALLALVEELAGTLD
jgi:hypothetical protein